MLNSFHHTRIAPTPSGYLHIGNALNFLLTDALAKNSGASVLLRIDDADRERLRPEYVEDIFDTLRWLEIDWKEGPKNANDFEEQWSQRHRMRLYEDTLQRLREASAVFACDCSRTQMAEGRECRCQERSLSLDAPNLSWRLITNDTLLQVRSITGETTGATLPVEMHQFIVRRKDGLPAYQLTSVVDDIHFGIDCIVRGQDLWPSTLAQLYLSKQASFDAFQRVSFFHHPLLTDAEGAKLSKSAGASSLKAWRQEGKTVQDLKTSLRGSLNAMGPVDGDGDLLRLLGF